MSNKMHCPVCDSYTSSLWAHIHTYGNSNCLYCDTDLESMEIISQAQEVLYDGYGEGVEVEDSPIIKLAIKLTKENRKLQLRNYELEQAMKSVKQAVDRSGVIVK